MTGAWPHVLVSAQGAQSAFGHPNTFNFWSARGELNLQVELPTLPSSCKERQVWSHHPPSTLHDRCSKARCACSKSRVI